MLEGHGLGVMDWLFPNSSHSHILLGNLGLLSFNIQIKRKVNGWINHFERIKFAIDHFEEIHLQLLHTVNVFSDDLPYVVIYILFW
jgi:hypothetical protein